MPRFRYVAMDAKGTETEGVLDAENQTQAISMIRSRGMFPTRVTDLSGGAGKKAEAIAEAKVAISGKNSSALSKALFQKSVRPKHLMVFTRQLATLIQAGLPLLRSLRILFKQEKNPALKEALSGLSESVEGGSTFSEALAQYPKVYNKLYVNMVKAGEAGGALEQVLVRLAEFMEKAERIKNRVKSAMVYPVVVLIAAVGILILLLVKVIPAFEEIFSGLLEGESLPALTKFVIAVSNIVQNDWLYALIVIGGVVVGIQMWKKTETGRYQFDRLMLSVPMFGSLFTKTAVARFSRTLGTLLTAGVPILQALNIVRDTSGNEVVSKAIQQVHDSVKEGDTMAMPMEAAGVFPSMVVSMVDVGEETGALPEMLMRVADNYDDEVDNAVDALTSIIEPIMIIMLAAIVGTIVIAMFLPLITIIQKLGQ